MNTETVTDWVTRYGIVAAVIVAAVAALFVVRSLFRTGRRLAAVAVAAVVYGGFVPATLTIRAWILDTTGIAL